MPHALFRKQIPSTLHDRGMFGRKEKNMSQLVTQIQTMKEVILLSVLEPCVLCVCV